MLVGIRQLDGMKMSIRSAFALVLLAAPAGAAPLCHDLRGLYTPCPPGQAKAKPKVEAATPAPAADAAPEPMVTKKSRPPLVAQGHKLCRDTKGLYTPCPR
jgi:hypothetical protein